MSEKEKEHNLLKRLSDSWQPVFSVFVSIIIAFIVTLIMINSHFHYVNMMQLIEPGYSSLMKSNYGYNVLILIGFVDLLILLGGVLVYSFQKKRKYSDELNNIIKDLKRSSDEYRSMQNMYELITENITDVIITTDLSGMITYITPSIESYLGITHVEMLGRKIEKYLSERSKKTVVKDMIYRKQNTDKFKEVRTYEIELFSREGECVWVELKTQGYSERGSHKGYLGVFRDVTKRKRNERYLKFQSDVLYNISDEVNIVDLDGKILYVNKSVLNSLNISKEEIVGRTKSILLPDPEYNISKEDILAEVKEKGHWEGVVGNYLPDGRRRVVSTRSKLIYDDSKHPVGIVSISTNITKKIEMEKELKQSEERYRLLIANVSDVIWTSDLDFRINFITRSVNKFLGYGSKEMTDLKMREYMSPDTIGKIDKLKTRLEHNFNKISYPIVFNAELICKNRKRKWAEAKINPLIDDDERTVGFVGVWRDITSFIQTSERNKALEERLLQSEKMEALGRLAGGVAHDLNNVLTGIVAYPDLLLLKMKDDDPMRKRVLAMKKSGQKAAAIVEDLLSMSRRGVNKFVPVDTNNLISEVLDSPEVEKLKVYHPNVRIKFKEGKDIPTVSAAEYQLSKVIINLLTNASEAMPTGGNIYISTRYESSKNNNIKHKNIPGGHYSVIKISDEGVGISKEDQKKIYEPFFTSKVMGRSGTGLGMAVVWGTIQDHNGHIELNSSIGEGTTFEIYLPALLNTDHTEIDIHDKSLITGQNEKVLVVDDEDVQLEIVDSLFTELNYNVKTLSDFTKIKKAVKEFRPDALVLDMILSEDTDGLDLYNDLKSSNLTVPTIIISGYSESERVTEAISAGVKKYIKKPFTIEQIGMALREILDGK